MIDCPRPLGQSVPELPAQLPWLPYHCPANCPSVARTLPVSARALPALVPLYKWDTRAVVGHTVEVSTTVQVSARAFGSLPGFARSLLISRRQIEEANG